MPFRLNLWFAARAVAIHAQGRSMADLLSWATPEERMGGYSGLSDTEILAAVKATVAHPWVMRDRRCLREGLLAFRFLTLAGYSPVLHFGILTSTAASGNPRGHCWVNLGGRTVLNPPEQPMLLMFTYDGTMVPNNLPAGANPVTEYA